VSKRTIWILGIAAATIATLAAAGVRWGVNFQLVHYAQSSETAARAEENEKKLEPILDMIEKLGDRVIADDAATEERAKLCRMGLLTDKRLCGEVGEEIIE